MNRLLRIGTRGSKLALAQATQVKEALEKLNPAVRCELAILKTSGDDFTAWKAGETGKGQIPLKGLFVKEIEEALLQGRVELAVHSVKDLQAELPKGLRIAAVLTRGDPRDALVTREGGRIEDLSPNTVVGASSLRRQAQVKRLRNDLEFVPIRGNVDTRLRKLDSQECGALLLAACGLIRLGLERRISQYLDPEKILPCPGQGALAVEIKEDQQELARLVELLNDPNSQWEVKAERSFLKALGGSCQVPVGALARVSGESLQLTGVVLSPDGLKRVHKEVAGPKQAAERLGCELASHLRAQGADRLLYGHWADKAKAS